MHELWVLFNDMYPNPFDIMRRVYYSDRFNSLDQKKGILLEIEKLVIQALSAMKSIWPKLSLISLLLLHSALSSAEPTPETSPAIAPLSDEDTFKNRMDSHRPSLGLQLKSSLSAFGGQALTESQGTTATKAFSFSLEYQPRFLQALGILSFGPSASIFPVFNSSIVSGPFTNYSLGGVARYQAKLFKRQFLVPVIGYSAEFFHYKFVDGPSGQFWFKGPIYGLYLLLNTLEPSASKNLFMDYGISRTYAIFELHTLQGGDGTVGVSGQTFYFGLRFEF